MINLIAACIISFLLGVAMGIKILKDAINMHVESGKLDIYVNGRRLSKYKLF